MWDNEILMGWYAANDGAVRSKGTMYFVLHAYGINLSGRWVGLKISYDGAVMTGWGAIAKTEQEARTSSPDSRPNRACRHDRGVRGRHHRTRRGMAGRVHTRRWGWICQPVPAV